MCAAGLSDELSNYDLYFYHLKGSVPNRTLPFHTNQDDKKSVKLGKYISKCQKGEISLIEHMKNTSDPSSDDNKIAKRAEQFFFDEITAMKDMIE